MLTKTKTDFADELRNDVIAIRLHCRLFATSRRMNNRQKHEVADHFKADVDAVGASKKLFPKCPELKAIKTIINRATQTWKILTIDHPETGVRLIRKDRLELWEQAFAEYEAELEKAILAAEDAYETILDQAHEKLGDQLFDRNDYPTSIKNVVGIEWDVHNFEPNEELLKLAPATYQREQERVRKQFDDAIAVYEAECKDQLAKLVDLLLERLTVAPGEKQKKWNESAANNLREFFDRFESLGVFSDETMSELVQTAKDALGGKTMKALKADPINRRNLADKFEAVRTTLTAMQMSSPSRSIDVDELED